MGGHVHGAMYRAPNTHFSLNDDEQQRPDLALTNDRTATFERHQAARVHETIKHRVVDGAEQMPLSQSLPGLFHFIIQHHRGLAGPASFRPMLEKQGENRKTSGKDFNQVHCCQEKNKLPRKK